MKASCNFHKDNYRYETCDMPASACS